MRFRWVSVVTVFAAVLLPLVLLAWGRSFARNDTLFRVGGGRMLVLNSIRGEMSVWVLPAAQSEPIRYFSETLDSSYGSTAREVLSRGGVEKQLWFLGFGYAEVQWQPAGLRGAGLTRGVVVPMWSLALLTGALPAWVMLRHMKRSQDEASGAAHECRRCGAPMSAGDARCAKCSFPALAKRSVVA